MGYTSTADFIGLLTPAITRIITILKVADDAPFYAMLLAQGRVLPTPNWEVVWYDRGMWSRKTAINNGAGYAAGITALVVDDASIYSKYHVVLVERTGEVMLVTAVDTGTNTVTVVRSVGTTAAAAIVDNDDLTMIGNASPETQLPPDSLRSGRTKYTNNTQIFRKSCSWSGTAKAAGKLVDDNPAKERQIQFDEIIRDIEHALLFGELGERTQDGEKQRFMKGILAHITQNVTDQAGTMTYDEHETFMQDVFQFGSRQKIAFCGGDAASAITSIYKATGQIQLAVQNDVVGFTFNRIVSAHGELVMVRHPHLSGSIFGGHEIVVDMNNVNLRPFIGDDDRSLQLLENVQPKGTDGTKDEWLGEMTAEYGPDSHHGLNKGITGAA